MLPTAARRNHRRQAVIAATVVASVRQAWRRMRPAGSWSDQWRSVGPRVAAVTAAGQAAMAQESQLYMAAVLAELDIPAESPTSLRIPNLVGTAGDGRPVDTLLDQAIVRTGEVFARTESPEIALESGQAFLDRVTASILSDTARAAESVALVQRPWVDGYVRMLNPPSCSRCALLAGRFYLWNEGFKRHPMCDCRHIPAMEEGERFGSMLTNPNLYFDSLSRAEQDKAFTKAGAQAIRDGADISAVINARRGMETTGETVTQRKMVDGVLRTINVRRKSGTTVDVFGHDLLITDEGVTKRGMFGHLESKRGGSFSSRNVGQRGFVKNYVERRATRARLMPESIYELANDREDAIRLLKLYGYIF